jgi:hypothetical protein
MRSGTLADATMDVGDWPRSLGLGEYEVAFRENGIDNKLLSKPTSEEWKELCVAALVGSVVQNEVLYTDRGREGFRLPSLRTVLAVFPHTALQSLVSSSGMSRSVSNRGLCEQ